MANFVPAADRLPIGHELVEGKTHHAITVYGADWCRDTARSRALLDRLGVEYNYYNIDLDPAMARTAAAFQNGGTKIPVIDLHEGAEVLIVPTDDDLLRALIATGRVREITT
jgi:glutaredoxin